MLFQLDKGGRSAWTQVASLSTSKKNSKMPTACNAPDEDTSYRLGYYRALENIARDLIGSEETDKIVDELSRKYE